MSKLLLVDDHPIFLEGLRQFLETNGHVVEDTARTSVDAIDRVAHNSFDLLVLDVSMADGGGLHILRTLRGAGNQIPIIFLTVGLKPAETMEAVKLGINGIVLKHNDPSNLITCIEAVKRGDTWIDPTIIERVLKRSMAGQSVPLLPQYGLTRRQEELVKLVGEGLRNREIARRCGLTEGTVKLHLHHIYSKLGISSRAQLIMMLAAEAM